MQLNTKVLVGLPVRTKAGVHLGRLASLDFDADTGRLMALRVRARGVVPGLLNDESLVAWSQVVSMDEREIVVMDAASPVTATLAKKEFTTSTASLKERSA